MTIREEYQTIMRVHEHSREDDSPLWEDVPRKQKRARTEQKDVNVTTRQVRKMVLWHYGVRNLQDELTPEDTGDLFNLLTSLELTFSPEMREAARRTYQDTYKRERALHLVGSEVGALIRTKKLINRLFKSHHTDAGHVVAFVYMLYMSCPWCRQTVCAFFNHELL